MVRESSSYLLPEYGNMKAPNSSFETIQGGGYGFKSSKPHGYRIQFTVSGQGATPRA